MAYATSPLGKGVQRKIERLMRGAVRHLCHLAHCNIGEHVEALGLVNKGTLLPISPVPTLFERKEADCTPSRGGAKGNDNPHAQSVTESQNVASSANTSILSILRVQKNVAGGNEKSRTTDDEGGPDTSDDTFAFDQGDDRNDTLL